MTTTFRRACLLLVCLAALHLPAAARASEAGKEMAAADAELNAVYQRVLAGLPDEKTRERLRASQRAWVDFVAGEVALATALYDENPKAEAGSKGGLFIRTELTETRTKQLRAIGARQSANGYGE